LTMFNFQGTPLRRTRSSFILPHSTLLVKNFFHFLKSSCGACHPRQLLYFTTSHSLCQALFSFLQELSSKNVLGSVLQL
ncbi:MAG: hypothetical protein IJ705_07265, partial [Oscillospiraceae bacterium]|nr:hypothetical protein [Oscillospiraceae bacterium]